MRSLRASEASVAFDVCFLISSYQSECDFCDDFLLDPSYFRVLDDDVYEACGLSTMQSTRFWDTTAVWR